jgi:hypothetical protein
MKPSAIRIERLLEKLEATLVPPPRKVLTVKVFEAGEDKEKTFAELVARYPKSVDGRTVEDLNWDNDMVGAQKRVLAEHIAAHPEDDGRTVKDFFWIVLKIVSPPPGWGGDVNPWYEQRKADAKRAAEAGGPHLSGEEAAPPGDAAAGDGDGTDGADPYSERGRRNLAPDPDDDLADDECADPEDRPGQVEVARRAFPPCSRYK